MHIEKVLDDIIYKQSEEKRIKAQEIKDKIKKEYPEFQSVLEQVKECFGEFKINGLELR